jgi:hypothetical protein
MTTLVLLCVLYYLASVVYFPSWVGISLVGCLLCLLIGKLMVQPFGIVPLGIYYLLFIWASMEDLGHGL